MARAKQTTQLLVSAFHSNILKTQYFGPKHCLSRQSHLLCKQPPLQLPKYSSEILCPKWCLQPEVTLPKYYRDEWMKWKTFVTRIVKGSETFSRLHANVWNARGISLQTKLKIYRATILPVLLMACETWTVYQHYAKKLNHFHTVALGILSTASGRTRFQTLRSLHKQACPAGTLSWCCPSYNGQVI